MSANHNCTLFGNRHKWEHMHNVWIRGVYCGAWKCRCGWMKTGAVK